MSERETGGSTSPHKFAVIDAAGNHARIIYYDHYTLKLARATAKGKEYLGFVPLSPAGAEGFPFTEICFLLPSGSAQAMVEWKDENGFQFGKSRNVSARTAESLETQRNRAQSQAWQRAREGALAGAARCGLD